MIRISQIQLPVGHTQKQLESAVCRKLRVNDNSIKNIRYSIMKMSLDARNKEKITCNYVVHAEVNNEDEVLQACAKSKTIAKVEEKRYQLPKQGPEKMNVRPYVIGSGPAGLFAAYFLAEYGYKPILIERGEPVEARIKTIENYWNGAAELNPESNIQFGEGGAGTFSDGKLNTGVNDPKGRNRLVLQTFVDNGAPKEILYQNKPHLGTDVLSGIVKNMRRRIIANGGEAIFNTRFIGFSSSGGALDSIKLESNGHEYEVDCNNVILALGHSARDTFKALYEAGIEMEQKAFAVGVRIEHLQEHINRAQYGDNYRGLYGDLLPAADYKLSMRTEEGRSVYTFCMCPGGYIVNASSEPGGICVNGMSYSGRNGKNANAAVIVSVTPEDFGNSDYPLAGIDLQRELEAAAAQAAGGKIPVQLLGDFMEGKPSTGFRSVVSAAKGDTAFANLSEVLPDVITSSLKEAFIAFNHTIRDFALPDAVLSAVESRTSSPVRILRNSHFESNIRGIYPCGEGAGYAGGITSAAMDGIKVFEEIYSRYKV